MARCQRPGSRVTGSHREPERPTPGAEENAPEQRQPDHADPDPHPRPRWEKLPLVGGPGYYGGGRTPADHDYQRFVLDENTLPQLHAPPVPAAGGRLEP